VDKSRLLPCRLTKTDIKKHPYQEPFSDEPVLPTGAEQEGMFVFRRVRDALQEKLLPAL
jgi:hypothetical protein